VIDDAAAYSARHQEQALLVERDGVLAVERYGAGFAADKAHALYSGTKSFWGVLATAATHDGLLELDEPVGATFVEWADDPEKAGVTLRMLLNLTSGFAFGGLGSAVPTYGKALATALRDVPGSVFTYGGIPLQVFGAVLAHKLAPRGLTPQAYLRERVLDTIPVAVAQWRSLKDGTQPLPTGAFLVAREWLAYGRFLLAGGPPVLPAGALAPCFAGSAVNARYGLGFWLYRTKGGTAVAYASGSGGQALYVAPERGTIAARFSGGGSYRHEAFVERLFA
jgi:CubicO group peptidase (beta-lactamase class C family)